MTRARDLAAFVSNADGDIKFDTDTLFIDSSANRVGIGETAPERVLHIKSADNIIGLIESTDADAWLAFQDDTSASNNAVRVGATGDNLRFYAGSAERMRVADDGDVSIGTSSSVLSASNRGNLTISGTAGSILNLSDSGNQGAYLFHHGDVNLDVWNTKNGYTRFATNNTERMRILAGGGLTFNGDTAAANALDDYEEGTFTPQFQGASSDPTVSYAAANLGAYIKIGRMVNFVIALSVSSYSGGSGAARVALPFTVQGGGNYSQNYVPFPTLQWGSNINPTRTNLLGRSDAGNAFMTFRSDDDTGSTDEQLSIFSTSGFFIRITGTYIATT